VQRYHFQEKDNSIMAPVIHVTLTCT